MLRRLTACMRRMRVDERSASGGIGADDSPLRGMLAGAAQFGEGGEQMAPELQWATQPYPARPGPRPAPRPLPRDHAVLLFPGEGSQYLGMGRQLMHIPAVKDLYDLASETVKWDVAAVCQGADAAALAARAQVCVLVTSLAALEAAREARPGLPQRARAAAGFSLGEVTALVFAGAIDLEPALRFVELRQAALAAAGAGRGGLATLWLAPAADLRALLRDAAAHAAEQGDDEPFAEVANYLYPGCKVVAGSEAALRWLEARGAGHGVRRAARVAAAGPLHCRAVRRAAPPLREALRMMEVRDPRITVVSNVDAKPYRDAKHIVRQLPLQACSPVRWEQTLHALFARPRGGGAGGEGGGGGFPQVLALGPGRALRATLKQVNAKAWDNCLQIDV